MPERESAKRALPHVVGDESCNRGSERTTQDVLVNSGRNRSPRRRDCHSSGLDQGAIRIARSRAAETGDR